MLHFISFISKYTIIIVVIQEFMHELLMYTIGSENNYVKAKMVVVWFLIPLVAVY